MTFVVIAAYDMDACDAVLCVSVLHVSVVIRLVLLYLNISLVMRGMY